MIVGALAVVGGIVVYLFAGYFAVLWMQYLKGEDFCSDDFIVLVLFAIVAVPGAVIYTLCFLIDLPGRLNKIERNLETRRRIYFKRRRKK